MPWIVHILIYVGLSGFISFGIFSFGILLIVLRMEETNGEMKN